MSGFKGITKNLAAKLRGEKYSSNLLGEDFQYVLRKATAKDLVQPDEILNQQVVELLTQEVEGGRSLKEIIDLLKARLRMDNPQKQYLAIILVGKVMSECRTIVTPYEQDLLHEVASVLTSRRPDSEPARKARAASKELLRLYGRAAVSAVRQQVTANMPRSRQPVYRVDPVTGVPVGFPPQTVQPAESMSVVDELRRVMGQAKATSELLNELLFNVDGNAEFEKQLSSELAVEVREYRDMLNAYLEQLAEFESPEVEVLVCEALELADTLDNVMALERDINSDQASLMAAAEAGRASSISATASPSAAPQWPPPALPASQWPTNTPYPQSPPTAAQTSQWPTTAAYQQPPAAAPALQWPSAAAHQEQQAAARRIDTASALDDLADALTAQALTGPGANSSHFASAPKAAPVTQVYASQQAAFAPLTPLQYYMPTPEPPPAPANQLPAPQYIPHEPQYGHTQVTQAPQYPNSQPPQYGNPNPPAVSQFGSPPRSLYGGMPMSQYNAPTSAPQYTAQAHPQAHVPYGGMGATSQRQNMISPPRQNIASPGEGEEGADPFLALTPLIAMAAANVTAPVPAPALAQPSLAALAPPVAEQAPAVADAAAPPAKVPVSAFESMFKKHTMSTSVLATLTAAAPADSSAGVSPAGTPPAIPSPVISPPPTPAPTPVTASPPKDPWGPPPPGQSTWSQSPMRPPMPQVEPARNPFSKVVAKPAAVNTQIRMSNNNPFAGLNPKPMSPTKPAPQEPATNVDAEWDLFFADRAAAISKPADPQQAAADFSKMVASPQQHFI